MKFITPILMMLVSIAAALPKHHPVEPKGPNSKDIIATGMNEFRFKVNQALAVARISNEDRQRVQDQVNISVDKLAASHKAQIPNWKPTYVLA